MRILVTGARGKVGSATVAALVDAGHDVTATDVGRPVFEARREAVAYIQADLTDAGDAFAVARGHEAVVHAAAIPDPTSNPPHRVFQNNLMAAFNTLEAAVRLGVARFVNLSSETVPGFSFPERPWLPEYVPVDERHPVRRRTRTRRPSTSASS
jgi:UDP-glucose 4-epimerase